MSRNFLDNLPTSQRDMIVSLPYRVGLCISESDEDGDEESSTQEAQALDNLLTAYSQEVFGAETVQYVISETVRRKGEWTKWAGNLNMTEQDCKEAVDIIERYVDPKEVSAFKHYLVEVGEAVALAFREYGEDTPLFEKIKIWLTYQAGKRKAEKMKRPYKSYDEFLNISLKERAALETIARALGTVYI